MALAVLPQSAVQAHIWPEPQVKSGYLWTTNNLCTWGQVQQWHREHLYENFNSTSQCQQALYRDPGQIQIRAEYYVEGQICALAPYPGRWYSNQTRHHSLFIHQRSDIWGWGSCSKFGAGRHVTITIDTWMRTNYGGYWYPNQSGGAWRPATFHCHCP